nr:chorismate mutase [uncultured Ottowia sp.]
MMKAIAQVRHCENMAEVRACVDALDDALVPLLVTRCGYMTQAARIKGDARLVHDQARIDQIVARVREQAAAEGGNPGLLERIYRALIDCCIAHEHEELRRLQAGPDSASSFCAGAAP